MLTSRQLFLNHNAQTSPTPLLLEFVKAKGTYLYDAQGKRYLDLIAGIGVSNIGHCHPEVVKAVQAQAETYMHLMVYGEFVQSPQVNFAKALADVLPPELSCTYFVNSGAEAVEGAMKLAKRYTGRSHIVAFKNSYHGSTHGALSLMGNETFKQAYRPLLPDIQFIDFNDPAGLDKINAQTAAVFIEPIQGEAGIRVADRAFIQALREKCSACGTLLVFDEIQTGFGRSGSLFAFEHYGLRPDILLLAKGIGGGMPIGAFIADKRLMDCLKENPILGHITTFGGHPVSCAAGLAALNIILEQKLFADVPAKEQLFRELLVHPLIKEVRGSGLLLAIQLETFDQVETVSKLCLDYGLIIDWFLHCDTALRIAPPLTITNEDIAEACGKIIQALDML